MAAGHHASRLVHDRGRGGQDRGHDVDRHAIGEGGDVEGEQHPPTHGEHVTARVGGGDGTEVGGIVHERWEEVRGRHHGRLVVEAIHSGVVERGQADEEVGSSAVGQRLHQPVEG